MTAPRFISKDRDINKALSQNQGKLLTERTKLHTRDIVLWLRRRFQYTSPNMNYLFFPEELHTHHEVEKIFKKFDEDDSGKLTIGEFYNMMRETGFNINIEDLRDFYQQVDEDHDLAFDFREFKNCTLSEEANFHFANMIKKLRETYQNNPKDQPNERKKHDPIQSYILPEEDHDVKEVRQPFLPRTFGNLLNYIAYTNRKRELLDFLNDEELRKSERFSKFKELIDLKMGKDVYLARYYERFQNILEKRSATQDRRSLFTYTTSKSTLTEPTSGYETPKLAHKRSIDKRQDTMEDLMREIEQIKKQAKQEGVKEFEERKARLRNMRTISTAVSTEPSSTPRHKRVVFLQSEQARSQFRPSTHTPKNRLSKGNGTVGVEKHDGFKIKKFNTFDVQRYVLPENVGRLDNSLLSRKTQTSGMGQVLNTEKPGKTLLSHSELRDVSIKLREGESIVKDQEYCLKENKLNKKFFIETQGDNKGRVRTEGDQILLKRNTLSRNDLYGSRKHISHYETEEGEIPSLPSDTSRTNEMNSWKDILERRNVKVIHGVQTTKASKMPSFYNNVSSTFDHFLTNTMETQPSSRYISTPTEFVFSSAGTRKGTENSSPFKPRGDSSYQCTTPGTCIKLSQSPSTHQPLFSAIGEKRQKRGGTAQVTKPGARIEISGTAVPKVTKSKSVRSVVVDLPGIRRVSKDSLGKTLTAKQFKAV